MEKILREPTPEDHNLRGRLYQVKDGAGQATFAEYDFKGNPISKLQETLQDYETEVNWDNAQTFDSTTYTTTSKHDALNRPVETVTPDSSKYIPTFNQGGDLDTVGVHLRGVKFPQNLSKNEKIRSNSIMLVHNQTENGMNGENRHFLPQAYDCVSNRGLR